jgi:chemotaxis protein methyltransferase CheR
MNGLPPNAPQIANAPQIVAPTPVAPAPPVISAEHFELVRRLAYDHAALVLDAGKEYLVEARLAPIAKRRGAASLAALLEKLRLGGEPALVTEVVEALTVNETSFFRDAASFEALRAHVLPELIRARAAQRSLRIWSAASSSGQEAYSLLMTVREHFPQLATWKVEVVGTDVHREMVERGRRAAYSALEIRRGLPEPLLARWFEKWGGEYRVKEELRRHAEFRETNLDGPWPLFAPFDLVLLRNVLIYFDVATRRRILARMRNALRADGWLLLGGSETAIGVDDGWTRTSIGTTTFYRP